MKQPWHQNDAQLADSSDAQLARYTLAQISLLWQVLADPEGDNLSSQQWSIQQYG